MEYRYSKFQKFAIKWLTFFTIACFVNSVLVIKYGFWDGDNCVLAFLLPFAHCGVIVVSMMGYAIYWHFSGRQTSDPDSQYIKTNYPDIWKRFHPWGDYSCNTFASVLFIRGKYDDGTDERLNQIKFRTKVNQNLLGWPFLLTIMVWIFSFVLMGLYDRFAQ